ncbi:hypothetical protein [Streptomyces sp. NPDC048106]|uniref:hypothetical protein n=1 Tax=Streptomyces sp. NPDC048106 TaxID=3155750 RepID=UPI0034523AC1
MDSSRSTVAATGPARRGAKPPAFPVTAIDDPALPEAPAEPAAARANKLDQRDPVDPCGGLRDAAPVRYRSIAAVYDDGGADRGV